MKRWSKLKTRIDSLFVPELQMQVHCQLYRRPKTRWLSAGGAVRFFVRLDKQIIWDFPGNFDIKQLHPAWWSSANGLSDLIREYIDTPVDSLLKTQFTGEAVVFGNSFDWKSDECITHKIDDYQLTPLFLAADRRLGKSQLFHWAERQTNPVVYQVLQQRYGLHSWSSECTNFNLPILGFKARNIILLFQNRHKAFIQVVFGEVGPFPSNGNLRVGIAQRL